MLSRKLLVCRFISRSGHAPWLWGLVPGQSMRHGQAIDDSDIDDSLSPFLPLSRINGHVLGLNKNLKSRFLVFEDGDGQGM